MKVLMISSDPGIHEETQAARRMEEYRQLVDELYTIVIAGRFNIAAFFRAYREGKRILGERGAADFLITVQDPPDRWVVGWLLAKRFGVPLEVQVHTDLMSPYLLRESIKNRFRLIIAHFIFMRVMCVRVVSRRIERSLAKKYPRLSGNITVLPVYVDIEQLRLVHRIEERGVFRFLMVSRLTREKNIELALKAFAKVVNIFPETKLVIVGEGPYRRRLEALALKLGLMQGKVVFTGWQEDTTRSFQYASCYVLTSNYEGYGRTVVEALAVGVPVIMTDVGVAGDIVRHEETGLVVPVGDVQSLVVAMRHVVEDSYMRRVLTENSRKAVENFPSKKEYLEAYKRMWYTCSSKKIV
ncbi:MAG: lipopolysaccharide biosynthesis protein [Parcubacteria group bacterium Gr01-1014_29]|nr:MAG: lipopolysaccharide biosynthesis protein [Parcubacteria group bacterium Gr01-1014_29]